MTKKIGDKKVTGVKSGEVKSTESSSEIKSTGDVGSVGAVKGAGNVAGAAGAGGVGGNKRRATRVMSYEEREQLFALVSQEAEKMFANTPISDERKKLVTEAVKMAIDSGILPPDEPDAAGKKKG